MKMRAIANEAYGEDFFSRWPNLYVVMWEEGRPSCPLSERGGVECGPGWRPILEILSTKLEAMILELPESERRHHRALQVKEKFFGLRFYMSCMTDEMSAAISEAEEACSGLCDWCGKPRPARGGYCPCARS